MGFRTVLTAAVVIGAVIETAQTGSRIVLDGPSGTFKVYDSAGDLGSYIGPGGGGGPVILSFEVGGSEFSAMWNGSCLVGLGDPVGDFNALRNAGGLKELGDGGVFVENTITAALPVEASMYLQGGTLLAGAPGTAGLPRIYLTSNIGQGAAGPADTIVSSAIIKADQSDPLTPLTWQTPSLGAGWQFTSIRGALPLRYRIDAEDNLIIKGSVSCTTTTPATAVFPVVAPYLPIGAYALQQDLIMKQSAAGAAFTFGHGFITGGNVEQNGLTFTVGDIISYDVSWPLGNLT